MDYQFENLGPERFQELCQALLVEERPGVQCFPVAQPDGGRDATSPLQFHTEGGFVVFQVKFARRPLAVTDPHKWLIDVLEDEAPKIAELLPEGASAYYLITNIPGTAHKDTGSIDRVGEILAERLPVPAMCWWRNDVSRRLDSAFDLKWLYPEIITGSDAFRMIIESGLREDKDRRFSAIRAFVVSQFDRDSEVRFRQVELQNDLLDLFVDVPARLRLAQTDRAERRRDAMFFRSIAQTEPAGLREVADWEAEYGFDDEGDIYWDEERDVGGATFVLHPIAQHRMPYLVIEGAPGQGKSTLAQYVCQVHRMHFLNKAEHLARVPEHHRKHPARLPIRVDLRDYATWLDRKNPFSGIDDDIPADWKKSFEVFLSAMISDHSGGMEFSVADLRAVVETSAVLLVLDGLDEVADITQRRELVSELQAAVKRLADAAASLQVVVTSRPAAFSNAPGFSAREFRYCELSSLTGPLIRDYADRWFRARQLTPRESSEVRKLLDSKLDQPHLRDLARNPMQLAILLSLIHTRGASLPDKRTALYDSYVDLFFSRESEKSIVVRENRDLLISIHQYLGWTLHSEAELGHTRGSITEESLKSLVERYLEDTGHEVKLVEELLRGVVERVVALVSRVEGTFEFEVQPLREYFAARYLYQTAPYSPPGAEKSGTLTDRLYALLRNHYWLNVTRFYAGCYSIGQIPSLVDQLEDLAADRRYSSTSHPRYLTSLLLSDRVFAQAPRAMREATQLLLRDLGTRHAFTTEQSGAVGRPIIVSESKAREAFMEAAFELLTRGVRGDFVPPLLKAMRLNSHRDVLYKRWFAELRSSSLEARTEWFRHGVALRTLERISSEDLEAMLDDDPNDARVTAIFEAGLTPFVESRNSLSGQVIDVILNEGLSRGRLRRNSSLLRTLASAVTELRTGPSRFVYRVHGLSQDEEQIPEPATESQKVIPEVIKTIRAQFHDGFQLMTTQLHPWSESVESLRKLRERGWILFEISNVAAGIRSREETCDDSPDLFDQSRPLCRRARYARLRAGAQAYWAKVIEQAATREDLMWVLSLFFSWAGPRALVEGQGVADGRLRELSSAEFTKVMLAVRRAHFSWEGPKITAEFRNFQGNISPRLVTALSVRAPDSLKRRFFAKFLDGYDGDDFDVWMLCFEILLTAAEKSTRAWPAFLQAQAAGYKKAGAVAHLLRAPRGRNRVLELLNQRRGEAIIDDANKYPIDLIALAETACNNQAASSVEPVGSVARGEGWFSTG